MTGKYNIKTLFSRIAKTVIPCSLVFLTVAGCAEKANRAVLMFAGDLMISYDMATAVADGSYDYMYSLDYVSRIFGQSDFAVANLETLISPSMPYRWEELSVITPQGSMPNCNSAPEYLEMVRKSGLDAVVTANNHCLDGGIVGITETIDNVREYGLLHTGTFKDADESRYIIVDINGIKIALHSYVTGSLNSMSELYTDEEMAIYINRYLKSAVKRDIKESKSRGAEYTVVFMHWGLQNSTELNEARLERAQYIADMGADYIVGAHPHVINAYDRITASDGRVVPCVYSMGNFLSGMDQVPNSMNRDTLIWRLEIEKRSDGVVISDESYIPCFILDEYEGKKYIVMPCGEEYGGIHSEETVKSRERITATLGGEIPEWAA